MKKYVYYLVGKEEFTGKEFTAKRVTTDQPIEVMEKHWKSFLRNGHYRIVVKYAE
jgi:hypothetical protein